MISDPFWFAMYMLLIAYLGAPAFLKIHLGVFRKAGLVWGAVLLAIFLIKNYRAYLENKFALVLFLFCIANGGTRTQLLHKSCYSGRCTRSFRHSG